jgi:protein subunit release factor B
MKGASAFITSKMARLAVLGLRPEEFVESFARASGPGGQHVNKVSTAVQIRHVPTGLSVLAQESRSQAINRRNAWRRILDAIEAARRDETKARRALMEKERRRKSPRPWRVKQKILESKKRRSQIKKSRARDARESF